MKHYFGNYVGSSSGYDPNVPTGMNKWDEPDYTDEEPYQPEPEEIEPEDDELTVTVAVGAGNRSNFFQNDLGNGIVPLDENKG